MPVEIERKFLVVGEGWRSDRPRRMVQGYLSRDKGRTVRVRIAGAQAFLTVKGPAEGLVRPEFEYGIPVADAHAMLGLCADPRIDKFRHESHFGGMLWEVDEFLGDNAGLVVAEIELHSEHQAFERPPWLGVEVTDDPRYLNTNLVTHPYVRWGSGGG